MITYRKCWIAIVRVATVMLAVVAALWHLGTAGMLFGLATLTTAIIAAAMAVPASRCLADAVFAGFCLPAVVVAVMLMGGWFVPLALLLIITSPPLLSSLGTRLRERPDFTKSLSASQHDVHAMSTAELCKAWSVSSIELEAAPTTAALVRVANVRQEYLDELECRDAAGVRAWIARRAGDSSDPASYLRTDDR